MEIKYRPSLLWVSTIVFCSIGILILMSPRLFNHPNDLLNFGVQIPIIIFVFISLYVSFGLYIAINENTICRTDYFIWKKCLNIRDIDTILYQPTWGIGQTIRRLQIINSKGFYKEIQLTNTAFKENDIAKLVSDLKHKNPSIQLDDVAEKLIQKYKNK